MTLRIEIAGGIASGKSTLCAALKQRNVLIIPENLDENPYLKRAYQNPASRGFDVQMAFLLSKASAIETLPASVPLAVCDYALVTEYAYTDMHLQKVNKTAWDLCRQAIDLKRAQIGDPDIFLHLDCTEAVQLQRIRTRGRDFEQGLKADYLEDLNNKIRQAVNEKSGAACQKIVLQSDTIDFNDPVVIDNLLARFAAAFKHKTGLNFPQFKP